MLSAFGCSLTKVVFFAFRTSTLELDIDHSRIRYRSIDIEHKNMVACVLFLDLFSSTLNLWHSKSDW